MMSDFGKMRISPFARCGVSQCGRFAAMWVLLSVAILNPTLASAQANSPQKPTSIERGIAVRGTVADASGKLLADAIVQLAAVGAATHLETKTDATGTFAFSGVADGSYVLSAEEAAAHSRNVPLTVKSPGEIERIGLVLEPADSKATASAKNDPADAMEFADQPNFTVAGVTDWTAAGGHGSDAILRTSENLARETITLKPANSSDRATSPTMRSSEEGEVGQKLRAALQEAPESLEANRQLGEFYFREGKFQQGVPLLQVAYRLEPGDRESALDLAIALKETRELAQSRELIQKLLAQNETAELHRLAGEVDEKLGDPLTAVHEFEQAVRLDPSEQDYFEWGSELLLHRAVWQAQQVFSKGAKAYPKSARMLAAWGAALFAGARYDEAASRLCEASDLSPADEEPYLFMGKIELATPHPLECVELRLQRYVKLNPENSLANYFYAMAIWKRQPQPPAVNDMRQVEALLNKAVMVDSKCSDGYLQLGILSSSQKQYEKASRFYAKAIEANPQSGDAHYRLGVAYDRLGEADKAKEEFRLHEEIEKSEAAAVEEQRREVKQFLVVLDSQAKSAAQQ